VGGKSFKSKKKKETGGGEKIKFQKKLRSGENKTGKGTGRK